MVNEMPDKNEDISPTFKCKNPEKSQDKIGPADSDFWHPKEKSFENIGKFANFILNLVNCQPKFSFLVPSSI